MLWRYTQWSETGGQGGSSECKERQYRQRQEINFLLQSSMFAHIQWALKGDLRCFWKVLSVPKDDVGNRLKLSKSLYKCQIWLFWVPKIIEFYIFWLMQWPFFFVKWQNNTKESINKNLEKSSYTPPFGPLCIRLKMTKIDHLTTHLWVSRRRTQRKDRKIIVQLLNAH